MNKKVQSLQKEFPKNEVVIQHFGSEGSLNLSDTVKVHYRNYKAYLDKVDYYILEGDKNTWYGVASDFKYDYLMGTIKDTYIDSFNRKMKVTNKTKMI